MCQALPSHCWEVVLGLPAISPRVVRDLEINWSLIEVSTKVPLALTSVTFFRALARWAIVRSFQLEYSVMMETGELGLMAYSLKVHEPSGLTVDWRRPWVVGLSGESM